MFGLLCNLYIELLYYSCFHNDCHHQRHLNRLDLYATHVTASRNSKLKRQLSGMKFSSSNSCRFQSTWNLSYIFKIISTVFETFLILFCGLRILQPITKWQIKEGNSTYPNIKATAWFHLNSVFFKLLSCYIMLFDETSCSVCSAFRRFSFHFSIPGQVSQLL